MQQLNNIKVPETQVVYGSIDYQNEFVDANLVNNNPKYYLTRMLNIIFTTAGLYSIDTCDGNNTNVSIAYGLNISFDNIIITNNENIKIGISPGVLIADNTIVNINDNFWLDINLLFENDTLLYDKLVILGYYDFKSRQPIKFSIHFYDNVNNSLINFNDILNDKFFIYRYLGIRYAHNKVSVEPTLEKTININGVDCLTRIPNCHVLNYIKKLEDYFGITYFLDIPYIPPDPRSAIFGVTRMFLN